MFQQATGDICVAAGLENTIPSCRARNRIHKRRARDACSSELASQKAGPPEGEFDVITCLPGRVVVHDARMHPDMRHTFMNHHDFAFDEAFSEKVGNEEVYARTARDAISPIYGRLRCAVHFGEGSATLDRRRPL